LPITICTGCQRRGTVAAYLATVALRCTDCGRALTVMNEELPEPSAPALATQDSEINFSPERSATTPPNLSGETSQPSITVSHEPEIPPLVLSPASPLSTASLPAIELEEDMAPDRLALYLKEIGTVRDELPSTITPTQALRAAVPSPEVVELSSPPPGSAAVQESGLRVWPASKFRRLIARVILFAMVAVLILAVPKWQQTLVRANLLKDSQPPAVQTAIVALPLIVFALLNLLLLQLRGQDIGKLLAGIRIAQESGQPAGMISGFFRRDAVMLVAIAGVIGGGYALSWYLQSAYPILPSVVLAILLVAMDLICSFSDSEQCLHDRFSGTRVVDT
jgi:uncharacterized RDD family membrane protein YckC